ncbi:Recombinase (RecA) and ATPase domain of putative ATP-dependent protease, partial [Giardia duodenalis]
VGIGDMPQSPRPLASAQAETPHSRKRLPVSYPGIDCASNRLQSALMRKQTDAEKAEMCTRPFTGSLVALRCIQSE